jgi:hypothetical protein
LSHIAKIQVVIKSLDALKAAVQDLGLEWSERKSYHWFQRFVGDTVLPEGIKVEDLGKCDYCISVPNNKTAYEVGVVKMPDGTFTLLYDYWQGGFGLEDLIGKKAQKLVQGYSSALVKQHYKKIGWQVSSTTKNGKVVLKAYK